MVSGQLTVRAADRFADWRVQARSLLSADVAPDDVAWSDGDGLFTSPEIANESTLFDASAQRVADELPDASAPAAPLVVSRRLMRTLRVVFAHDDRSRHALMYRVLWRAAHEGGAFLGNPADADVSRLALWERAVGRDMHKAKAFVRFKPVDTEQGSCYSAWFEPSYRIVELVAPFFAARFTNMRWALATPRESVFWDLRSLRIGPGVSPPARASQDSIEAAWRKYYASIFNPARVKIAAMKKEMPMRYWRNLPESTEIAGLIRDAGPRVAQMISRGGVSDMPDRMSGSKRSGATAPAAGTGRAVGGEGPTDASIVVIGEQPGHEEDLAGRPFVGPAGKVLDEALARANVDRKGLYVTNAVKHFGFTMRGKRRLHKTPGQREIMASRDVLFGEIERIGPRVIVCLGRTAVLAMTHGTGIKPERGKPIELPSGTWLVATWHPSYALRAEDQRDAVIDDIRDAFTQARALAGRREGVH